jgi:hypothetical protein
MEKGNGTEQAKETDIAKLAAMAKSEIDCGKANYITFEKGKQGEQQKILRWIIAHSPKWRSGGTDAIKAEMRRLRLWED